MKSQSESYKAAGVDITAGYQAVELMKKHIARTVTAGAMSDIGGFGGLFEMDLTGITKPVLVSGTDGVGTKLKLAFLMDKHDTVGIDCVAMCVNDIICCGAKPLFFLDYIAVGKNFPEKVAAIVSGVAEGCVQSGAALIGGETAEMPGFYPEDEYDLAGFAVGVVDKDKILDNKTMEAGDVVIALPSSGVHSNGFSLVRRVFDVENADIKTPMEELGGKSLGETLLAPTKIYVKPMLALFEEVKVKAVSHITGGGFYENIPRSIPKGFGAKIDKSALRISPIFKLLAEKGNIPERDMFNTFNMGVGMSVVVAKADAEKALEILKAKKGGKYNVIEIDPNYVPDPIEHKQVFGVTFEQGRNELVIDDALFANVVTENKEIPEAAKRDLAISMITLKYTQSNSVCYVKDGQAIGIGAGQQSRIHCTRLAGTKADNWFLRQSPQVLGLQFVDGIKRADRDNAIDLYIGEDYMDVLADGAWENIFKVKPEVFTREEKRAWLDQMTDVALGSDAFFPFGDNIERAHRSGVKYIAQPGGSVRDDNVIETCNKYKMAMAFTGIRLFHH